MAQPFSEADDLWDAAADGVLAIDARLSRLGLCLCPCAFDALRHTIAGALSLAEVEGVEG